MFTVEQLNRSPTLQADDVLLLRCCQDKYPDRSTPQKAEERTPKTGLRNAKYRETIHPNAMGQTTAIKEDSEFPCDACASCVLIATIKSATHIHFCRLFFEVMSFVIVFTAFTQADFHLDKRAVEIDFEWNNGISLVF